MKSLSIIRNIKNKIVIGIALVLCTFAIAGVHTYNSFNRMLQAMDTLSKPEAKLVHLNEVMTEISNAEGSARAYTLTKEQRYLRSYWEQFSGIESRIQHLRENMQNNDYQLTRIDSVASLLEEKQSNLQSFLLLKDKEAKNAPLRKALKIIDQKAKDIPVAADRPSLVDPITPKPYRKSGNQRTRSQEPKAADRILPSQPGAVATQPTGELLDDVKDIISNMENEETRMKQYLGKQELDIIEQDWLIMDQIRSIIRDVRREELLATHANDAQARQIATDSVAKIVTFGGIALLVCAIFIALVFKDLAQSNYYRSNLISSMKRAKKLARVKEEFLANMSHEIRTPLNAITGFLEQLKKTQLNGEQYLFVDTIESSSDHLLSIVNDILDLSKIESGKLTIDQQPFSVRKVMQTVIDVMRVKAQEKNITISREMDRVLDAPLLGDAHRLRQILFNLVGNAVKFTERGGVSVRARAKESTDDHISIEFSVEDTGSGIAKDKLEHIFGAFNQEDGVTGQRLGGTGLGLAISKKLVELQNGWIGVESVPEQGSTFSFCLQYSLGTTLAAPAQDKKTAYAMSEVSDKKVLVVDDDHVNRLLLEVLSEKWDAQVDIVDSGLAALDKIHHVNYDIVLTDINMPKMSGTELMQQIKARNPLVPVIAFTATAQPDTLKGFIDLGFNDYLLKPFKESDLRSMIARYTHPSPAAPAPSLTEPEPSGPEAVYSLEELTAITKRNPRRLADILELIVTRCPADVQQLEEAAAAQQWRSVAQYAHKLRSPFGQIGAMTIVQELEDIERKALARTDDPKVIAQLVRIFAMQAQAVFGSLKKEIRIITEVA